MSKAGVGQAGTFSSTITIPSVSFGSNSSADIRVVLNREGQDYAECFLVRQHHDDDSSNSSGGSSTFKVSIAKVTFHSVTVFRQLVGRCDVDLSTDGIQPGVPAVEVGDVATASSVVNSVRTEFPSGIFVQP